MKFQKRLLRALHEVEKHGTTRMSSEGSHERFMKVEGRIALVTGGTTGIGYAIACKFLEKGAKHVIITGSRPKRGEKAVEMLNDIHGSNRVSWKRLNALCPDSFETVFEETHEQFGSIDILCNNAGVFNDRKWEDQFKININGVVNGTLAGFAAMVKSPGAKVVVNTASIVAIDPLPWCPFYCASKAAVLMLSRCLGSKKIFKKSGIRVVTLCPGLTESRLFENLEDKFLNDTMSSNFSKVLEDLEAQPAEVCGTAASYIVETAPPGTIWVVEGSKLFEVCIPRREELGRLVCHL